MADNTEREAFEAAMRGLYPSWSFAGDGCGGYHAHYTETAWQAWQARALAQGEPGEAPDGRLHADGYFTWNTGKRPNYRADLKLPCDFYLSPTASAPAAEREPLTDEQLNACFSSVWSNDYRTVDQRALYQALMAAHDIGTKEPAP